MLALNPLIELVNVDRVSVFVNLLFAVVGVGDVLQHTPRAEIVAPPKAVTLPPLVAATLVIADTAVVLRLASTTGGWAVTKLISLP